MTASRQSLLFEHKSRPLLPVRAYLGRVAKAALLAGTLVAVSLAVGMAGYVCLEGMTLLDAFVNAAMLLSGMGPLSSPQTAGGKLFAGLYALYSGFVVLIAVGMVAAPVVHRYLHRFHLEEAGDR